VFYFKKIIKSPLFWIFVLALILRIYKLGSFPVGFHADEARVAWNSLSILKTGKDDKGNKFALYYDTFGDYRPTGIFYFTIPSLAFFGNTEFATRFPSSLFGALTVIPLFLLVREISIKNKKSPKASRRLALTAGFLLAISSWHIEVSRATSEVVISTFFVILSTYFFIRLINTRKKYLIYLTLLSTLASYLLYHAIRFLGPPIFVTIGLYYFKRVRKNYKTVLIPIIFVCILSLVLTLTPEAKKRFGQVSIFGNIDIRYEIDRIRAENDYKKSPVSRAFDNKYYIYIKHFAMQYGDYFSENFLTGYSAKPYRYATPGAGLITYTELALLIFGILEIVKGKYTFLPLLLLILSPLPAAITTEDAPNLHRAFLMIPFLITLEAVGFVKVLELTKKYTKYSNILLTAILLVNFFYFLHMYFSHSNSHKPFIANYILDDSSYRNTETKKLVTYIDSVKSNYDKIIITDSPDSIYPWYAFFTGKDPGEFNKHAIERSKGPWNYGNIVFSEIKCPSDDSFVDYKYKKLLVIDGPACVPEAKIKGGLAAKITNKIVRDDGSTAFTLLERN